MGRLRKVRFVPVNFFVAGLNTATLFAILSSVARRHSAYQDIFR
jgi:hypothetical protein